jgi:hypothetical protein
MNTVLIVPFAGEVAVAGRRGLDRRGSERQ